VASEVNRYRLFIGLADTETSETFPTLDELVYVAARGRFSERELILKLKVSDFLKWVLLRAKLAQSSRIDTLLKDLEDLADG
jgi:hypothetical protein